MSEGLDKDTIKSELPPTYLWQNVVISQKSNQPEVIQCILYKLKTDCQWHMLPVSSFFTGRVLHYKTMYGHLRKWSRNGEWEKSQDDFYINITIVLSDCTKILNSFGYFSLAT